MNYKTIPLLLTLIGILVSCKSNFIGKELTSSTAKYNGFKLIFVNDSILKVNSKTELNKSDKTTYKYKLLKKVTLETIKKNQPPVNFKIKKLNGQFYQKIAIELVSGKNHFLKGIDTLNYIKMRIDKKMTKRIYFDNGNKFVEF